MAYNKGDILGGSFAVKVSEPAMMSPRLLIGIEGSVASETGCFAFNQSKITHMHTEDR